MKAQELITKYPEKSFADKFKEKEVAIQGIGAPVEQIQNKREEFRKLFIFDDFVQALKNKLQEDVEREIDSHDSDRIVYLVGQLSTLSSYLDNLNYSDPNNVDGIFQNFKQNTSYLFQTENYNINSSGISSGRQVIDVLIGEIKQILQAFDVFSVDTVKFQEAEAIAAKLTKNEDRYSKAIITAENWIKSEGRALSSSLQDKAQIFDDKAAQDHKTTAVWGWFCGGIFFGVIAFATVLVFIFKSGTDISVGSSFLRISALIVTSYFAFYCLQQFTNHRKLYEAYKFKAIALQTMEELVKSHSEPSDRDRILNKAINVIFSEPSLKEETNAYQKIANELLEIAKKKI